MSRGRRKPQPAHTGHDPAFTGHGPAPLTTPAGSGVTQLPTASPRPGPERTDDPVELTARDERQRALRALLQRPLMHAHGPDAHAFVLVRRHARWLQEWLAQNAGWSLQLTPELARLRKFPGNPLDQTRPQRDRGSGAPFNRRRYMLFCLALAALEYTDRQTILGDLAEKIAGMTREDPVLLELGMAVDLKTIDQRRDLVAAVRLLLELQVLVRIHGDEQAYLADQGDALYNVNRVALAAVLSVRRGPSTLSPQLQGHSLQGHSLQGQGLEKPATVAESTSSLDARINAILEEPLPDTDDGRNRRARISLTRQLLDDPVVYFERLSPEERAYLTSQRPHLLRQVQEATGLQAEVRREGLAMIDETGTLTDVSLPDEGTDGHVALLIADFLVRETRRSPGQPIPLVALHRQTLKLSKLYHAYWRKETREPGAELSLVEDALERLEALRLIERVPGGVLALPALGRFSLSAEALAFQPSPDPDLLLSRAPR